MLKYLRLLATLAFTLVPVVGWTEPYPSRLVKLIVPYPAGQGADVAARVVAEYLGQSLGQSIIIFNRSGAAGNIGTIEAARAAPDGYTLVYGSNATQVANRYLYSHLGYDPETDFVPIGLIGVLPMTIAVSKNSPYQSLQQLIQSARAKPNSLNVALPSTTAQVVFELFKRETQTSFLGVPYRASTQAVTDLMGGQIHATIDTIAAIKPLASAGRLRALAVTTATSTPLMPGVPSVAEQGVPGFELVAWSGYFVPRGTPPDIINILAKHMGEVMKLPQVIEKLQFLGIEARFMEGKELELFLKAERGKWGSIIKAANIRME